MTETDGEDEDTAVVVCDDGRRKLLWTMVEFLRLQGALNVRARLPGFTPPSVLDGTLQNHRPDMTCQQGNKGKTSLILDVVLHAAFKDSRTLLSRLNLLASAGKLYGAEVHLVASQDWPSSDPEQQIRSFLRQSDISNNIQKIWVV